QRARGGLPNTFSCQTARCIEVICREAKENRPLFAASGQRAALIPVFSLPLKARGSARRQGALPGLLRAGVRIAPDDGRETSRPAPCGAQTRHLGFYAFDRGRPGPAP